MNEWIRLLGWAPRGNISVRTPAEKPKSGAHTFAITCDSLNNRLPALIVSGVETGEKKKKKKKKKPIWYKSTQEESLEISLFFAYSLDTVKMKIHYCNCLSHFCFGLYAQVTGVCLRAKL
jgi:hypothetical protein